MHIEAKDQQSANLPTVVTNKRAVPTDILPPVLERAISDLVIFTKTPTEPQRQMAAFSQPLEGFHDLPDDINLSLPNESVLKNARLRLPNYADGEHNFDGEIRTKSATNLSASNTKARTLLNAGSFSILKANDISNVTPGEPC